MRVAIFREILHIGDVLQGAPGQRLARLSMLPSLFLGRPLREELLRFSGVYPGGAYRQEPLI